MEIKLSTICGSWLHMIDGDYLNCEHLRGHPGFHYALMEDETSATEILWRDAHQNQL